MARFIKLNSSVGHFPAFIRCNHKRKENENYFLFGKQTVLECDACLVLMAESFSITTAMILMRNDGSGRERVNYFFSLNTLVE
jgi:hypothetical protein